MKYLNKSFSIEGIRVANIAKKFATPIYCYSYNRLEKNIISFKKNFKSFNPLICFSVKSNSNVNLLILPNSNNDELFLYKQAKKMKISEVLTLGKNVNSNYCIQKIIL